MERTELEERYAKARRELIARDFGTLNDMQLQAALTTEGPLLLLAGAGSGKTTVLINRIVNLIRYGRGSDSPQVPSWVEEEDLELLEDAVASGMSLPENLRPFCALEPVEPWYNNNASCRPLAWVHVDVRALGWHPRVGTRGA